MQKVIVSFDAIDELAKVTITNNYFRADQWNMYDVARLRLIADFIERKVTETNEEKGG